MTNAIIKSLSSKISRNENEQHFHATIRNLLTRAFSERNRKQARWLKSILKRQLRKLELKLPFIWARKAKVKSCRSASVKLKLTTWSMSASQSDLQCSSCAKWRRSRVNTRKSTWKHKVGSKCTLTEEKREARMSVCETSAKG